MHYSTSTPPHTTCAISFVKTSAIKKASAVEKSYGVQECDARDDATKNKSWLHKINSRWALPLHHPLYRTPQCVLSTPSSHKTYSAQCGCSY